MVSKIIRIKNKAGLHARPASNIVSCVKRFRSSIYLIHGGKKVDARSIINILTLGARQGTELEIVADGKDEGEALEYVTKFIESLKD